MTWINIANILKHNAKFEMLACMVADLCQLQFVAFSFCRGEKTTKRQDD
jgi:hypothetical protein